MLLENQFQNREALIDYVKKLAPWSDGEASEIVGHQQKAKEALALIDPINYGTTRNHGNGKITRLSPYISHGMISLNEVRNMALEKCSEPVQITKFLQELTWRDFWRFVAENHPNWLENDAENYKTGYAPADYQDYIPDDILNATTEAACLNDFLRELYQTGYVHNHARMYLASYIVHFRRVKWQVGAQWMLSHLIDAEISSNHFSWQWVASCFGNKPYIFNLENVEKYFRGLVNTDPNDNKALNHSYEALSDMLFNTEIKK